MDKAFYVSYFINKKSGEIFASLSPNQDKCDKDENSNLVFPPYIENEIWKHISAIERDMIFCERGLDPFAPENLP